jgi:hypothetical protein
MMMGRKVGGLKKATA